MRHNLLIIAAALFIAGCQSKLLYYVGGPSNKGVVPNKQYKDQDFSARRVAVLPIPLDAITITDTALVQKDFNADQRTPSLVVQDSLYRKIIFQTSKSLLENQLRLTALPSDLFPTQTDTSKFFAVNLPVHSSRRDTTFTFYVPRKELFPADSIDVGIIITGITIGTETSWNPNYYPPHYMPGTTVTTPGGTFQTPGTWFGGGLGQSSEPAAAIQFIMWDYQSNKPIVHGFTQATDTKVLSGNTLSTIFRVTAQRLFEDSPFRFRRFVQ